MFETVQIARRHLLRFEYPEMAAALDTASSPAWAGAVTGALGAWLGGQAARPEPGEPEDTGAETDTEAAQDPLYCWALFPYY